MACDVATGLSGSLSARTEIPRRLIVPADGLTSNHRSINVAASLAAQLDVPIHIVSLVRDRNAIPVRQRLIRRLTDTIPTDLTVTMSIDQGDDPAAFVVDQIAHPKSMVVLSAGSTAHLIPGSVTAEVIRFAQAPVMFTGPFCVDWTGPVQSVLVPVDGSRQAERCFDVAATWAAATTSPVELVNVLEPRASTAEPVVTHDVVESGYAHLAANSFSERYALRCEFEVLHAPRSGRATVIAGEAARIPGTIVCMTSTGQHGVGQATTASRVIHSSPTPVLMVRH
jgi:nucleotide-binding universal stress UspA family protein